ncbi:hypothetical protein Scep_001274 [Stephania cephalantha]|uniref:DUF4283 domain-containing protein n=1 Tax=Stephania cephalantha TaxID=152367 RepID=A0AAP0L910_9MAGN
MSSTSGLSKALFIFRNKWSTPWEELEKALSKGMAKPVQLQAVGADMAILLCANEEEQARVYKERYGMCRDLIFRIHQWNPYFHWMERKSGRVNCWIAVEGLPLNMWNKFAFKMIGDTFGGLVEVHPNTINRKSLERVVMKVKGSKHKFLNKEVIVPCCGRSVTIQIVKWETMNPGWNLDQNNGSSDEGMIAPTMVVQEEILRNQGGAFFSLTLDNSLNAVQERGHNEEVITQSDGGNVVEMAAQNVSSYANLGRMVQRPTNAQEEQLPFMGTREGEIAQKEKEVIIAKMQMDEGPIGS